MVVEKLKNHKIDVMVVCTLLSLLIYVNDIFRTNGTKEVGLNARCKPFDFQNSTLKAIQIFLRLVENFNIRDEETIKSLKNRTI